VVLKIERARWKVVEEVDRFDKEKAGKVRRDE
jgi:hypothetical protein